MGLRMFLAKDKNPFCVCKGSIKSEIAKRFCFCTT